MGAQGTTTINFGAFPGGPVASATVTGQGSILAGSLVEAWLYPVATSDHTVDEHLVDGPSITVLAANVVAGTGFSIFGMTEQGMTPLYGAYTVAWVWN